MTVSILAYSLQADRLRTARLTYSSGQEVRNKSVRSGCGQATTMPSAAPGGLVHGPTAIQQSNTTSLIGSKFVD